MLSGWASARSRRPKQRTVGSPMNTPRSWRTALLVAVALAVPGDGDTTGDGDYAQAGKSLAAVNQQARALYAGARERVVARSGPVVLYNGDELVLRYGSVRLVRPVVPVLYHDLKAVGHLVMSLDAMLGTHGDGELDAQLKLELRRHRDLVETTKKAIRNRRLSKEQDDRQQALLDGLATYLDGVLREGKAEGKQRVALMRKLRPVLDANNADAVRSQLDLLHREMLGLKEKLTEADWKRLRVIIQASQQPRKDNVAVQYFARLLGEAGEGLRLVYAESIYDEAKALA